MRVWVERERSRGNGEMFGLNGVFGMRHSDMDAFLGQAQRALHDPRIRQQLGINEQEADKLGSELTSFRKTLIQDRANLAIQRIDLENLLQAESPDKSAVDRKLQQMGAAQLALEKSAVDFALNVKQELTPQQLQKIRQFLRWRGERRFQDRLGGGSQRRGYRRGGRRGPGSQSPQPPQ